MSWFEKCPCFRVTHFYLDGTTDNEYPNSRGDPTSHSPKLELSLNFGANKLQTCFILQSVILKLGRIKFGESGCIHFMRYTQHTWLINSKHWPVSNVNRSIVVQLLLNRFNVSGSPYSLPKFPAWSYDTLPVSYMNIGLIDIQRNFVTISYVTSLKTRNGHWLPTGDNFNHQTPQRWKFTTLSSTKFPEPWRIPPHTCSGTPNPWKLQKAEPLRRLALRTRDGMYTWQPQIENKIPFSFDHILRVWTAVTWLSSVIILLSSILVFSIFRWVFYPAVFYVICTLQFFIIIFVRGRRCIILCVFCEEHGRNLLNFMSTGATEKSLHWPKLSKHT